MTTITQLYQHYQACGGKVVTDTRKITAGCLFVALRGDNFDGNTFAAQALSAGAQYAPHRQPRRSRRQR